MKGLGIRDILQQAGVLRRAGRVEQMASGARRQDQTLEAKRPGRDQQAAIGVIGFGQAKAARVGVEPFDLAKHKPEMIAAREREIVETFLSRIQRAGRDLVKRGLPQMENRAIYEKHLARPVAGPQPAPETGGELKSASPAAHD